MNLLDLEMVMEIDRFGQEVAEDDHVSVIVFDSADPDFFIAHGDVEVILGIGDEPLPKSEFGGFVHGMLERFRIMPKISIAKVEGAARGGGSEFALAMDMRFAAIGKAVFCQPEVSMGIIPGAGGTQRLPSLIGSARSIEVILGCDDIPAEVAAHYGLINRAMGQNELGPFVDSLAFRIASFPRDAIAAAKRAIRNATELAYPSGLIEEESMCNQLMVNPEAKRRMKKFMEVGGQERRCERDFQGLVTKLSE